MKISKLIEMAQRVLEEHGDLHVVLDDEVDCSLSQLKLDDQGKVIIAEFNYSENNGLFVNCDNGGCKRDWREPPVFVGDAIMYNDCYFICKDCFENDFEIKLYCNDAYKLEEDENGEYTKKNYLIKGGISTEYLK